MEEKKKNNFSNFTIHKTQKRKTKLKVLRKEWKAKAVRKLINQEFTESMPLVYLEMFKQKQPWNATTQQQLLFKT